jgi:hypothetical protein
VGIIFIGMGDNQVSSRLPREPYSKEGTAGADELSNGLAEMGCTIASDAALDDEASLLAAAVSTDRAAEACDFASELKTPFGIGSAGFPRSRTWFSASKSLVESSAKASIAESPILSASAVTLATAAALVSLWIFSSSTLALSLF